MRNAFAAEMTALAARDPRIVLLSGDMGNRLFDGFKREHPDRFFNCGIAEANMTSLAAGLALAGMRPFTYSIAPFVTTRCIEQIKIDICYHDLPVIIVGVGAGLSYAGLGATHHSFEDIALLRVMPNMTVVCPGDSMEVRLALRAALGHEGPVYIRLGKKNEPAVHSFEPQFTLGRGIIVREGKDVSILSTGTPLSALMGAAEILGKLGISAQVVSMHTVKPLDSELLEKIFSDFTVVTAVEEHSTIGGFTSAIAEWLSDRPSPGGRLMRIGIPDAFQHGLGSIKEARDSLGFSAEKIAEKVLESFHDSRRDRFR